MSALHADARRLLRAWRAPGTDQEQVRRRLVGYLEDNPDGLARECFPAHVTASTLIVSPDGARVLLTLHAKADAWFQVGGHCEPADATLAAAALREAREESGIVGLRLDPVPVQLSAHDVPFCSPRGTVQHLDVRFLAVAPEETTPTPSEESTDLGWWPVDDLPNRDPDLLALVALARDRLAQTSSGSRIAAAPSSEQSTGSASIPSADAAATPSRNPLARSAFG